MQLEQNEPGSGWRAIILQISVASVLSGFIAYLATAPVQPVDAGAKTVARPAATRTATPPTEAPLPPLPPVLIANPFDPAEVFEFPSGTSETEARQAVVDLLLQRARDRQKSGPGIAHRGRKTLDSVPPSI